MSSLLGVILRSIEYGSIYALAALGIVLIFRTSFTTNFAQGVIGMFNAFVVATIVEKLGLGLLPAVLIGVITAILTGVIIDVVLMRHAKKVSLVGKQILTLGVLLIITGITPMIFGPFPKTLPQVIRGGSFNILGARLSHNATFNIIFTIALLGIMLLILLKTKAGLSIRATASNENTARLMGIKTKRVTMISWAVAAVLSLLAATMAAPFSVVNITFMNDIQITAFMAVVLGGFSTFHGPVIASFIISITNNILQVYIPQGTIWGKPIVYILILVFLIFKPRGMFGKEITKKV
ncbi:MAG: branched-chain amino acid ABC transporter permease [Clostridiaceae bacterium]|nr:branched-chain amino acid ABC transporter permease [Clostridiaceae bacterium]